MYCLKGLPLKTNKYMKWCNFEKFEKTWIAFHMFYMVEKGNYYRELCKKKK